MKKDWINKQTALIGTNNCYFSNYPKNIGKILYCDTSALKETHSSHKDIIKRVVICSVVTLCLLLSIWTLGSNLGYQIIGTVLVTLFSLISFKWIMRGTTDYYIGELGFSIVKWNADKSKIKSEQTIFFENISLCFWGDRDIFSQKTFESEYDRSEFSLSIYKSVGDIYVKSFSLTGTYKRESKEDPDDLWMFADYNFANEIAVIVGREKAKKDPLFGVLKSSVKNTKLGQTILKNVTATGHTMKSIGKDSITEIKLADDQLIIGLETYNYKNINIDLKQGWLVITDNNNHSTYIELSAISHNKGLLSKLF